MVIYDLICEQQHRFEGWFRSLDDFNLQHTGGMLACPLCDNTKISKLPSASYINSGAAKKIDQQTASPVSVDSPQQAVMQMLRDYLQQQSADVGKQFAEEAKKIHYGETKPRNIHGQATVEELLELHDEGVEAYVLPFEPIEKKRLN
jgi:hypothetical protein